MLLYLVGKRKPPNYNKSKRKTSYSLEKFYYFKLSICLKVGAPGTFEILGTFAHGFVLSIGDLTSLFLLHCSVYESGVRGSHLRIQGMKLTDYGIFLDPVTHFPVPQS